MKHGLLFNGIDMNGTGVAIGDGNKLIIDIDAYSALAALAVFDNAALRA